MTKLSKTIPALASACLLLAVSGHAAAQNPLLTPLPSTKVDASDLDIRTPGHAEILYERIRRAAHRVCTLEHDNWWDKARVRHRNRCIERAIENTVYEVNVPPLTLVHLTTSERERVAELAE